MQAHGALRDDSISAAEPRGPAEMRAAAEYHGGSVGRAAGGRLLAVFTGHEDDPLRAARAALQMRRALEALRIEVADGGDDGPASSIRPGAACPTPTARPSRSRGAWPRAPRRGEILLDAATAAAAGAAITVEPAACGGSPARRRHGAGGAARRRRADDRPPPRAGAAARRLR